jgi:phosphoribosyl-AMP cyclohydrolase
MNTELDFEKMSGLLPAVVQDFAGGEVLMVGFMNRQALERTLEAGYVTFFSRTRNELWTKVRGTGSGWSQRTRIVTATRCCCGLRSKERGWSAIAGPARVSQNRFPCLPSKRE